MPVNFFGEFMSRSRNLMLSMMLATASLAVQAQSVQTLGTQVIVPASGEIIVPNDQARATLMIEEQDKDKVAAASRVNQKMKQGIDIVKRQDPQAVLKSHGYFTYAIYSDTQGGLAGFKTRLGDFFPHWRGSPHHHGLWHGVAAGDIIA